MVERKVTLVWPEMSVDGETFSPEEQDRAWGAWQPERGFRHLAGWLGKAHHTPNLEDTLHKAAHKMIDAAKDAGLVEHVSAGRWRKL